ncbi:hypothetical protein D3C80_968280 [compost metagenome]
MADRNAAGVTIYSCRFDHGRKIGSCRIEAEIEVEIDIDVMFSRQCKDPADMFCRIGIGIGAAADQVRPRAKCVVQHGFCFRFLRQPFLREGADLDIDGEGVILANPLYRLEGAHSGAWVDFNECPHAVGAMHYGLFDQRRCPLVDVVLGEPRLCLRRLAHGLLERSRTDRAAFHDAGLVEMDMAVNKAGKGKCTLQILYLDRLASDPASYFCNQAFPDGDVDQARMVGDQGIAENEIDFHLKPIFRWRSHRCAGHGLLRSSHRRLFE